MVQKSAARALGMLAACACRGSLLLPILFDILTIPACYADARREKSMNVTTNIAA